MKKILILAALSAFVATPALAKPKWSIVGVGNMASPKVSDGAFIAPGPTNFPMTITSKSKTDFGGGILLEVPLSGKVGLETGAMYVPKKYDIHMVNTDIAIDRITTDKYSVIQIPLLFKFWLTQNVGIGLGGYYAQGTGQVQTTAADGTVTKDSYEESHMKRSDYGLLGSLNLAIPLSGSTSFLLGGQYAMGLAELFVPSDSITAKMKTADIQAFAGFRFGGK